MLYILIIDVIFYQVNLLMFYNVQSTNLAFFDKNMRYVLDRYSTA